MSHERVCVTLILSQIRSFLDRTPNGSGLTQSLITVMWPQEFVLYIKAFYNEFKHGSANHSLEVKLSVF